MPLETMYPAIVNSPLTELTTDIDATQTTIEIVDGNKLPVSPNLATIGHGEDAETILYTTKTGSTLSGVTRGFQGIAKAWSTGQPVARYFTAYDLDSLIKNIESVSNIADDSIPISEKGAVGGVAKQDDFTALRNDVDDGLNTQSTNLTNHINNGEAHGIGDKSLLKTAEKTTIVSAINEVFTNGNNVKVDTVDALLSVDDGLPITSNDSWSSIIDEIRNISVGYILPVTSGAYKFYNHPTNLRFRNITEYTELLTFKANFSGVVKISYAGSSLSTRGSTRIYVNHEPVGTEYSSNALRSEDVEVSFGDYISFYGKTVVVNSDCILTDISFSINPTDFYKLLQIIHE